MTMKNSNTGNSTLTVNCTKSVLLAILLILPAVTSTVWGQAKKAPELPPGAVAKKPSMAPTLPELKPNQVRVNVGVSTAKPEDIIDIPITLSAANEMKINSVIETFSYTTNVLSLTRTELGLAGEQSKAEVKTEVKDGPSPDLSTMIVTITSPEQIKPGILTYLKFQVATDATKGTISMKVLDTKVTGDAKVDVAQGRDGEVNIFNRDEEIPIVGCFFFNH
jgi:hypothetical protein